MKKTFALLVTLMLLVAMLPTTAMAYTAVTIPANTTVEHTLALTKDTMEALPYDITYTFVQDGTVEIIDSSFANASMAVTGNPTISPLEYKAGDTPDETTRSYTKLLNIDWSKVTITEPGVYRWAFTKEVSSTDPVKDNLTNDTDRFYLYVYVTANAGAQLNAAVVLTDAEEKKDGNFEDSYPATLLDLSMTKAVTGNQASPDQYFEFAVTLQSPVGVAQMTYDIDYTNATEELAAATAYNGVFTNPAQIVVPAGGTPVTATIWMKDGESVKIPGLIFNTIYKIEEKPVTGYTTEVKVTNGDDTNVTIEGATITDTGLTLEGTTVKFTNTKNTEVPTGVILNTAAPMAGILLALSLLAVLFIGKRREEQA